jgi:HSP20 family molecular chaperone IbpA
VDCLIMSNRQRPGPHYSYRTEKELKKLSSHIVKTKLHKTLMNLTEWRHAMKSTVTTNAPLTTQTAKFKLTASGTLVEQTRLISAAVARRAYELFEARGSQHGHDREDWFRAESELLAPIPATIIDTDGAVTVRAELCGLMGKDVEVLAEPRHLMLQSGKQTSEQDNGRAVFEAETSAEIFRVLDLPSEIDPHHMKATIDNEVVEITLAKVNPGNKNAAATKAA